MGNIGIVLVCSDQVGSYINALSYLYDKKDVTEFDLLYVTGDTIEAPHTSHADKVIEALDELSNGKYEGKWIELTEKAKQQYGDLATILRISKNTPKAVELHKLSEFFDARAAEARPDKLIIDVTGMPKFPALHVTLLSLPRRYSVYTFELRHRFDREQPEKSLYSALPSDKFSYASLTDDSTIQAGIRQLIPVRRVFLTLGALFTVGLVSLVASYFLEPTNSAIATVGVIANVLGIGGSTLQFLTTRKG